MKSPDIAKTKPFNPLVKIARADLKDMIRDELYGWQKNKNKVVMPVKKVGALAKRIARRAIIGH